MDRISPREARKCCENGDVYLDVRSELEFEEIHPAGAWNVPWARVAAGGMVPNPDFLPLMRAALTGRRLVVGCRSGGRSALAATALQAEGWNVVEQRAGTHGVRDEFGAVIEEGWIAADLPVEVGPTPGYSYRDLRAKFLPGESVSPFGQPEPPGSPPRPSR